ncbi:MAG: hypothetical protein ABIN94_05335 [Ferruginibacter sp.]
MKLIILTLTVILFLTTNIQAAVPSLIPRLAVQTAAIIKPIRSDMQNYRVAQMKQFIGLTADRYGVLRGKKLNFLEKISFHVTQRRMKKMLKTYEYGDEPTTLQKISWLLKGLLFGPLALLFGYLFLKDEERELIKWIWFGFAGFAAIVVVLLLTL